MTRVVVAPISRIEGHARVDITLDAAGRARDARLEAIELRGFESICLGRPIREMPALTARICGICPAAHSVAAAAAGDVILGADPPPAARALRRILLLAGMVQSHATSFFDLCAPDFVFGHGAPDEERNVFAVAQRAPALARDGVVLRQLGQDIVEAIAGRRVHPAFAIPGGVAHPLDPRARDELAAAIPRGLAAAERSLAWWEERSPERPEEPDRARALQRSWLLGHRAPDGTPEVAGGELAIASPSGEAEGVPAAECLGRVIEREVPWSRAKLCALATSAGPRSYLVGPLARLRLASRCGTPRADRALARLRSATPELASPFDAHAARLVEILHALERIASLLADDGVLATQVTAPASPALGSSEGVGACEAPRGALFHRYAVDEHGLVVDAAIVTPTGQNARAINAVLRELARKTLRGPQVTPELRARIAAAVRQLDPCISCATHTAGGGPGFTIRLLDPAGELLDAWPRE